MADKPCSCSLSQINAEVETLGFHYFCEEFFHVPCQLHNFKHFLSSEVRNVCLVFVGRNHEMPAVVRIFVQDTEAFFPSMHNEVFFIPIVPDCATEKTAVLFRMFLNICNAPGRPK